MATQRGRGRDGKQLLRKFLNDNELRQSDCAAAIGVTRASVCQWLNEAGSINPGERTRKLISRWTNGAVPESSWPPVRDRRKDSKAVVPYKSGAA